MIIVSIIIVGIVIIDIIIVIDHTHHIELNLTNLTIAIVVIEMITVEQAPAARSARSSRFQSRLPSRDKVNDQVSVEEGDKDDLLQGDDAGVVQLLHEGRLPLQVVGDVGDVDHVKRRHLRSHLLAQDGSSTRSTLPKDPFPREVTSGQLVVAD